MIFVFGVVLVACGKKATKNDDELGIYEEQLDYLEKSKRAKEISTLQEFKVGIKNVLCDGYAELKVNSASVVADAEGRIAIASLFDTNNEDGRNFVKSLEEYMDTEYISFSSKRMKDCTLQILNFDAEKFTFTIKLVSEATGENVDI